jgi:hypothetical protein
MDNMELPLLIAKARAVPKAVTLFFSRIRNTAVSTARTFGRLSWNVFLQKTLYLWRVACEIAVDSCQGERADVERSSHRQTQLQLIGLENDMALKAGDVAPDFELPAIAGERQITMRSRDYLGRQNLVVAFHPLDWTPT